MNEITQRNLALVNDTILPNLDLHVEIKGCGNERYEESCIENLENDAESFLTMEITEEYITLKELDYDIKRYATVNLGMAIEQEIDLNGRYGTLTLTVLAS